MARLERDSIQDLRLKARKRMTKALRILCVTSATLLASGAAAFAQDSTAAVSVNPDRQDEDLRIARWLAEGRQDPGREANRAERLRLGVLPVLQRFNDELFDRAEAARVRHAAGQPQLGLTAHLERVDCTAQDNLARARRDGALRDARVARVIGGRNDRLEREEHTALEGALATQKLRSGQFERMSIRALDTTQDDRYDSQHQKRQDVKTESRLDPREDRNTQKREKGLERDESFRQRMEERNQAKVDAKAEKDADKKADKAEKADDKKADQADKKADALAEKKADKADAAKDRADDRKDVRTDAKTDAAADKKTP